MKKANGRKAQETLDLIHAPGSARAERALGSSSDGTRSSSSEAAILELVGDLDRGALAAVADMCGQAARGNVRCVVLDLLRVEHLDYAGIAHLVACKRKLRARKVDLVIVSTSRYLRSILRVGGGADIEVVRSVQEAIDGAVVGAMDLATASASAARRGLI